MSLDKLHALIEAYNPASSQRTAESVDAHHKLALLAHSYLLPAMEALDALDACAQWDGGDTPEEVELNYTQFAAALGNSRAVLAQLSEALK